VGNPGNPAIPVRPPAFRHRLANLARRIADQQQPVKIVALGSSTTAGEGSIPPYPGRLEAALLARYPGRAITVVNNGHPGEEAPDEVQRIPAEVIDEKPDMVIWQVGTNAVWNGDKPAPVAAAIKQGLKLLRGKAMDIVLMDLQYVPAVLTPKRVRLAERMVDLIAKAAADARAQVNVFQRFAYMRAWCEVEKISFDRILDPADLHRLHQSDWSTQRIADALCQVMLQAL
jgi:lysophospholipase L1-like esterase